MELIRKLETRVIKDILYSYGEFLCLFCNKVVERQLSAGKRQYYTEFYQNIMENKINGI